MTADKLKQYIGLFGGMLGALYLALNASGIEFLFNARLIRRMAKRHYVNSTFCN